MLSERPNGLREPEPLILISGGGESERETGGFNTRLTSERSQKERSPERETVPKKEKILIWFPEP